MALPRSAAVRYYSVCTLLPTSVTSSSSVPDIVTHSSPSGYVFAVDSTKRQLRYYRKPKTNAVITAAKIIRIARHCASDADITDSGVSINLTEANSRNVSTKAADCRKAKCFALFVVGARLGETECIYHRFDCQRDAAECADVIEALIGTEMNSDSTVTAAMNIIRQSRVFKKGTHMYSARTIRLITNKLLISKDDKLTPAPVDVAPSHVIRIAADVIVTQKSDRKLRIATAARDFTFRFNKSSERDDWFNHIIQERDTDDVVPIRKSPFSNAAKDLSPLVSTAPPANLPPPISRRTSIALFNHSFIPYPTSQPILTPPPMPIPSPQRPQTASSQPSERPAADAHLLPNRVITTRPRRMTLPLPQRIAGSPVINIAFNATLAPPRNAYNSGERTSPASTSPIPPPPLSPPPPPPPLIRRIPALSTQSMISSTSSPLSLLLTERERDALRGFVMSTTPSAATANEASRRWSTTALTSAYSTPQLSVPPTSSSSPPMYRLTVLTDAHESIGFVVLPPASSAGLSLSALRQIIFDQFDRTVIADSFLFLSDGVPVGRKQEAVLDAAVVIRNSAVTVRPQRTSVVAANRLYRIFIEGSPVAIGVVDVEENESGELSLAEFRRRMLEQIGDAVPNSFLFQIADGVTARVNQESRLRVSQIHNEQLHIHLTPTNSVSIQ